jgi:hypothetical protein
VDSHDRFLYLTVTALFPTVERTLRERVFLQGKQFSVRFASAE